jgi:hypothetical protein
MSPFDAVSEPYVIALKLNLSNRSIFPKKSLVVGRFLARRSRSGEKIFTLEPEANEIRKDHEFVSR